MLSFGGARKDSDVRDLLETNDRLKASIDKSIGDISESVVDACLPNLTSRQKTKEASRIMVANAVGILKTLFINVADELHAKHSVLLLKVSNEFEETRELQALQALVSRLERLMDSTRREVTERILVTSGVADVVAFSAVLDPMQVESSNACDVFFAAERRRLLVHGCLVFRAVRLCNTALRGHLADEVEANLATKNIRAFLSILMEKLLRAIPVLVDHFVDALADVNVPPFPQLLSPISAEHHPGNAEVALAQTEVATEKDVLRSKLAARKSLKSKLDILEATEGQNGGSFRLRKENALNKTSSFRHETKEDGRTYTAL